MKRVTGWGNVLLRRIPFEEWGLKTIPPLSARRREAEMSREEPVEVLYPALFLDQSRVPGLLKTLATERQSLHRNRMVWSMIGVPISLPLAVIPVMPNLPGFYLAFRAYSHWKGTHITQSERLCSQLTNG